MLERFPGFEALLQRPFQGIERGVIDARDLVLAFIEELDRARGRQGEIHRADLLTHLRHAKVPDLLHGNFQQIEDELILIHRIKQVIPNGPLHGLANILLAILSF